MAAPAPAQRALARSGRRRRGLGFARIRVTASLMEVAGVMDHRKSRTRRTMPSAGLLALMIGGGMSAAGGMSARAETPPIDFAFVPAADAQPGGPAYNFRIGRFEVRNDQFVLYLNDAKAHPDNARGQFMYFDTDSGDVYIHTAARGAIGTSGSGPLLFLASANAYVGYDPASGAYEIAEGFEDHPVTGVTWYGAVKYCNWLTIDSGLSPDQQAYSEAAANNLNGWHPGTISTQAWATRDLNDAEREALLGNWGYRLPMDGGDDGGDPSPYNEWYKAAAWDGSPGVNRAYGFGRDAILGPDANFRCSGDPFEDPGDCIIGGTTPVGFYNGMDVLGDEVTPTRDTENAYGLYDMSGNVWEWMQDQSFDPADRRNRSGSFRSSESFLRVAIGAQRAAGAAGDATGFRVAQSAVSALLVTPHAGLVNTGPWGGPYDADLPTAITYRVANITDQPVAFMAFADAGWITVDYAPPPDDRLPGGDFVDVRVQIAPHCSHEMRVGMNEAAVTILNLNDGGRVLRSMRVNVTEPLTVSPAGPFPTSTRFGKVPPGTIYTIASQSASTVSWSARWVDTTDPPARVEWVILDGESSTKSGNISPFGVFDLSVGFDTAGLPVGTYSATVTITDECTQSSFVRPVTLTIMAPFAVAPTVNATSKGVAGGAFDPPSHPFILTGLVDGPTPWQVTIEPIAPETNADWLAVVPSGGTLNTIGQAVAVTASITPAAAGKDVGRYAARLRFEEPSTGWVVERTVTLDVTGLFVEPSAAVVFTGPLGGPFEPPSHTYTLHNTGPGEMEWTAGFTEHTSSGRTWPALSATAGVILNPRGTASIIISMSPEAALLPTGVYTGEITFTSALTGATATRGATLEVGTEAFALATVKIPAEHAEPNGPSYLYRIGKFEVTNANYVRFLNDAMDHPDEPRGAFVLHDAHTGVARLTDDATPLFDAAVGGAVSIVGGRYVIERTADRGLPVVGVSWYGAAKFCNWMTLVQGMQDPDERVYHEGPTAADWYAMAAPPTLLTLHGFRLPMDARSPRAAPYNEWYKAAAWINGAGIHAVYGFGRDTLSNSDANFRQSGDPYEPGPCPVGYFNGVDRLAGGGLTNDSANGYGLYDMTGNVAEWVHDLGDSPTERGCRGGHFASVFSSPLLRNDARASAPAAAVLPFVGFRVAQVIEPAGLTVTQDAVRARGFVGGPYRNGRDHFTIRLSNPGPQTIDAFSISVNVDWLQVDGAAPRQIPPGNLPADIPLRIQTTPSSPGLSAAPPGDFVLVRGDDIQIDGPDYAYWIGRSEVTNAQYAAFLNSALLNARSHTPDARSDYMYFHLTSGSVYVNSDEGAAEGTEAPSATLNTLLYDAFIGRVHMTGSAYAVDDGFEDHPVVGVSWYGAIKYCNWLSISQGIPAAMRAYTEAPSRNLDRWHPVVVDDLTWVAGAMPDAARRFLVEDTLGYRLPMDDSAERASPYNEWYKAASRRGIDESGDSLFGAAYGFGRNGPPTGPDANFWDSGDTADDGTTSVRFFNGLRTLYHASTGCYLPVDVVSTNDTDNGYQLYDATGNVAEWMQDLYNNDLAERSSRGGSWRDDADSNFLRTDARRALAPDCARDDTGFRVVRGTGHVGTVAITDHLANESYQQHFILDLHEPFEVRPVPGLGGTGTYGDPFAGLEESYTVLNRSLAEMPWTVSVDRDWIDLRDDLGGQLQGTLAGGEAVTVQVTTNHRTTRLGPGTHTAVVTFRNGATGHTDTRDVILTIDWPITAAAGEPGPQRFRGVRGGPFDRPPTRIYELSNVVDFPVTYAVSTRAAWLTVEPQNPADQPVGRLAAGATVPFVVSVNDAAEGLAVNDYDGAIAFTFTDPANANLSATIEQSVTLIVEDPITVSQDADPWVIHANPDPDSLSPMVYTLTSAVDFPVDVVIGADVDWVDVAPTFVEVLPGADGRTEVGVSLNANVLGLVDGSYRAMLAFEDTVTGIIQCRTIELPITQELSVTPFRSFRTAGTPGGPFTPPLAIYRVTNVARDGNGPVEWRVYVAEPGATWVLVDGATSAGGRLDDGEWANVTVSVDAEATAAMSDGTHEAVVEFEVWPDGGITRRTVSLFLGTPRFPVAESHVPGSSQQPDGPTHSYRMAVYHTTNAEFAAFLNDAMENPDNERGQYMYFDVSTGDVYVNSSVAGVIGADAGSRAIRMFSPSAAGRIELAGGVYRIRSAAIDYATHPVTGVSWYGALKFANWLTIDQGMLPAERCYTEATDADPPGWHPVTITTADWLRRDLADDEQADLVLHYGGFRLPMDDGSNNGAPTEDAADAYNEWYKAASRRGTDAYGRALFGATYGFGRSGHLTGSDANFLDSGDPMDNGTTPVGYFDGSYRGGGFYTNPNGNGFGLFDMSGNAYQWMQDRFNAHSNSIAFRAVRGGSWMEPPDSPYLRTDARNFTVPHLTDARIGFRVVRTLPLATGDFDFDGAVDLADFTAHFGCASGPGHSASTTCSVFDFDADADVDLWDFAQLQTDFGVSP